MPHSSTVTTAWQRLRDFNHWRTSILPGLTLIGLVIGLRLMGLLQPLEWKTLDFFLRHRPPEPVDERITIVAIDEADLIGKSYPISDQDLSQLLRKLDAFAPRAVAVDIFRDKAVDPGHEEFIKTLIELPYVYGIEYIETPIAGPAVLPDNRIGFVDFTLDADGLVRRSILGNLDQKNAYRFSLAVLLAEAYLKSEGITLENGIKNPVAMRFGEAEIPPFYRNTGSYIRANDSAQQTLLNVRSGPQPFRSVSLAEVMTDSVPADWLQDRVIIIGIVAPSHKDIVYSGALINRNPGDVYGVEMHAHATSQLLSATLENRPLLTSWTETGEYLWIACWGAVGIFLVGRAMTPLRHLVWVVINGSMLVLVSYGMLISGWWLPVVPTVAVFLLTGLVLPGVLLYDQMLRSRLEEGQRVIRQTYSAVHNGPLQTLALLLREIDQDDRATHLAPQLQQLNTEIRQLYDNLEKELEPQNDQLHLKSTGAILGLSSPLHELLYEVYQQTLQRDFPNFQFIKFHIVKFDRMQDASLKLEEKRSLCRFLEEALCNVGRYANGLTRLEVTCMSTQTENIVLIEDNGNSTAAPSNIAGGGKKHTSGGRGTRQANLLAKQLRGKFSRTVRSPHGMRCELRWPI